MKVTDAARSGAAGGPNDVVAVQLGHQLTPRSFPPELTSADVRKKSADPALTCEFIALCKDLTGPSFLCTYS